MKIGVDLRCLSQEPLGGIARATKELWETWQEHASDASLVGFFEGTALALRKQILMSGVERLFCPTGAVPPFCPVPAIPWIHDLAIFDHPEWFPQNVLRRTMTTSLVLRGIRRAPKILAVSEDTKKNIVRIAGVDPVNIEVTYQGALCHPRENGDPAKTNLNGLPDTFELGSRLRGNDMGRVKKYALILGTVEPRKQPSWVVSWWEQVHQSCGLDLVVAGPSGWGGEEERLKMAAGDVPWLQRFPDVNEPLKIELIRNATCVLLPSLHEGFGRVALEAMTVGTPVIVSDRGALPEVVGDGGPLLDPEDSSAWIKALGEVVGSEELRRSLIQKGQRQAERFSWPKIAQGMLASLFAS